MKKFLLAIIFLWVLSPQKAFCGETYVSASRFDLAGREGVFSEKTMIVKNLGNESQEYEFYSDDVENSKFVNFYPSSFSLAPNEEMKILARFRNPNKDAFFDFNLVGFSKVQASAIKIGGGIKIPISFKVGKVAGAREIFTNDRGIDTGFWIKILILFFMVIFFAIGFVCFLKIRVAKKRETCNLKISFI